MDYEIKIFSELNAELRKDWENLEKDSHNYCFQSYDWFETWTSIYRSNNNKFSLCIVVLKLKAETIAILPFEIEKKYGLKILKWAENKQTDYCSPVLSKKFNLQKEEFIEVYKTILNKIKNFDIVYFVKQPKYVGELENPFVFFLNNFIDSKTHNILLPKTWEDYNSTVLKKNFYIQNLRKEKLLKKLGNVSYKIVDDKNEKIKILDKLFVQKNTRLGSQGINDAFRNTDQKFYKYFQDKILTNASIHLSYIDLNGDPIAIHWGIIYKQRFYYLLLSMEEGKLKRYSPGRLLISSLIKFSISKELKIFDFTLGDENYKVSWSNKESALYNHAQLNSLNGLYFFLLIKIKLFLKQVDKRNYIRKIIMFFKKIF